MSLHWRKILSKERFNFLKWKRLRELLMKSIRYYITKIYIYFLKKRTIRSNSVKSSDNCNEDISYSISGERKSFFRPIQVRQRNSNA